MEKRLSKTPERFGHGAIEGVAGPESANNAAAGGASGTGAGAAAGATAASLVALVGAWAAAAGELPSSDSAVASAGRWR